MVKGGYEVAGGLLNGDTWLFKDQRHKETNQQKKG